MEESRAGRVEEETPAQLATAYHGFPCYDTGMDLTAAILAVETAQNALTAADSGNAQAQSKFDAAKTALDTAKQTDADAITGFNKSLDDLIAAATAAKRS